MLVSLIALNIVAAVIGVVVAAFSSILLTYHSPLP